MSAASAALPRPSDLSLRSQALYRAAVRGDYGLRTGLASVLSVATTGAVLTDGWRKERRRLEWYAESVEPADRALLFPPPEHVFVRTAGGRNPGLDGGRVELLRFDSGYVAITARSSTTCWRRGRRASASPGCRSAATRRRSPQPSSVRGARSVG